jgi:bifunctional DNA-binding transcriptional regulator/antitoxin component of YhaV-PrlF toxin-antitoxin module
MATVHYSARVQENGSLLIPADKQAELGIRTGDSVEVVLQTAEPDTELLPVNEGESLVDYLGDFIGCVAGSGANNSDDSGLKFAEDLVEKHRLGRL